LRDLTHWLKYFPSHYVTDLRALGTAIDLRRAFITTDKNPYYDAFIQWQYRTLQREGKLKFGKRHSIFSPKDGQACADHDRASGEGVTPQEYTVIKLRVLEPLPAALAPLKHRRIYLAPATLRPETMYGQTNCFVLPTGDYGAYEVSADADGDVFVMSEQGALNFAYQGLSPAEGKIKCLASFKGTDLIGAALRAPLAQYERVYVLPMLSIKTTKGTGVVTSVPSDAPDDWAALRDMQKKADFRAKYGLRDEMVLPFAPVPIIVTSKFGELSAVTACDQFKVNSQNDAVQLATAKDEVYKAGFYDGVFLVGEFKGAKVSDAKDKVRQRLIEAGDAVPYWEPMSPVVSRSGDTCVVALTDQWYVDYAQPEWKATVRAYVTDSLETYGPELKQLLLENVDRMHEWGCSRSFGLGTHLPADPQFLIESLSDSTIYMAYYTIAHLLQAGNIDPDRVVVGPLGIKPEQCTDAFFDAVFRGVGDSVDGVSADALAVLRREFQFWYPWDVRTSGRDLAYNHLVFALFHHVAFFPPAQWPRSIKCCAFLCVDNAKMSKCLALGTPVLMADGTFKSVELVKSGDFVMGDNGAPRAVTKTASGEDYMVQIAVKGQKQVDRAEFDRYEKDVVAASAAGVAAPPAPRDCVTGKDAAFVCNSAHILTLKAPSLRPTLTVVGARFEVNVVVVEGNDSVNEGAEQRAVMERVTSFRARAEALLTLTALGRPVLASEFGDCEEAQQCAAVQAMRAVCGSAGAELDGADVLFAFADAGEAFGACSRKKRSAALPLVAPKKALIECAPRIGNADALDEDATGAAWGAAQVSVIVLAPRAAARVLGALSARLALSPTQKVLQCDEPFDISVANFLDSRNVTATVRNACTLFHAGTMQFARADASLPIDAWLFGFWLGDGCMDAEVAASDMDLRLVERVKLGNKSSTWAFSGVREWGSNQLLNYCNMAELGFQNKHIPDAYKYGSVETRMQVLAGMLDADGSLPMESTARLCLKNQALLEDFEFVARSLGFQVTRTLPIFKSALRVGDTCHGDKGEPLGWYYTFTLSGDVSRLNDYVAVPRNERISVRDASCESFTIQLVNEESRGEWTVVLPDAAAAVSELEKLRRVGFNDIMPVEYAKSAYAGFTVDGNGRFVVGERCFVTHNSAGNFITLADGIERFSADATRVALADAGDTLDVANFDQSTANAAILRLHSIAEMVDQTLALSADSDAAPSDAGSEWDERVFEHQQRELIADVHGFYNKMLFRDVVRRALHEYMTIRERYVISSETRGRKPRRAVLLDSLKRQMLLLAPIVPHLTEHCWKKLGGSGLASATLMPAVSDDIDRSLVHASTFLEAQTSRMRKLIDAKLNPKAAKKGKAVPAPPAAVTKITIGVTRAYPAWQARVLDVLRPLFNDATREFSGGDPVAALQADQELQQLVEQAFPAPAPAAAASGEGAKKAPKGKNHALIFFGLVRTAAQETGAAALATQLQFDEMALFKVATPLLEAAFKVTVTLEEKTDGKPGEPQYSFD
jgi:leucyl-tRNA synthetase